ncbi:MAG: tetratricopeptide repeat protein [Thermodesulfovibrionia bacterium]|nr:tetratricopeptide repeat protein [Thermodesulfovibrionia bacterium]
MLFTTLSFLVTSCDKSDKTTQKNSSSTAVTGPIIDTNLGNGGVMARLDTEGKSPESLSLMGDKYFENGQYVQAISVYRKVIELNPKDVDTYNDLGLSLHYTRQTDEAIDVLRKGSQLDPNYQNIWLSLGYVLAQSARNDEAKIVLQHTEKINPNSPQGQEARNWLNNLK